MPSFLTAKQVAENALNKIGAFPSSMSQADQGELRTALRWLEMTLNAYTGMRKMPGFTKTVDIPVEAGIGDYNLGDYTDSALTQQVFSVSLINALGDVDPLTMMFEDESDHENLTDTGNPQRCLVTRDIRPILKVFPQPTQNNEDKGDLLRVRLQSFHEEIDPTGNGDIDLNLRPSWNMWAIKRLAYEIGSGPVRRLSSGELDRIQAEYVLLENALFARDGLENAGGPPVTQPMIGS